MDTLNIKLSRWLLETKRKPLVATAASIKPNSNLRTKNPLLFKIIDGLYPLGLPETAGFDGVTGPNILEGEALRLRHLLALKFSAC